MLYNVCIMIIVLIIIPLVIFIIIGVIKNPQNSKEIDKLTNKDREKMRSEQQLKLQETDELITVILPIIRGK